MWSDLIPVTSMRYQVEVVAAKRARGSLPFHTEIKALVCQPGIVEQSEP